MKIKSILITLMIALPVATFAASPSSCVKNEKGAFNISGEYICTISCDGLTEIDHVTQDGDSVRFINGVGDISNGKLKGLNANASEWGLSVTVSNNCQELIFSNSSIWLRK
ncbi:MAG: hypothetical protein PHN45_11025 [Methylococcales bacterium]|nr:hypothetical protein [Methylococcales bacterium]MDD5755267.1 hypothetical protein [Methylococcales bacterium]